MGVIVWSPLAGGWLAGKYRRGEEAPKGSRAARFTEGGHPTARRFDPARPGNQRKLDLVEDLAKVAVDVGVPMASMAVAFTLAHPAVTAAIIGPRTPQQLADALATADLRLDAGALDAIDAATSSAGPWPGAPRRAWRWRTSTPRPWRRTTAPGSGRSTSDGSSPPTRHGRPRGSVRREPPTRSSSRGCRSWGRATSTTSG